MRCASNFFAGRPYITSIKHCAPRISSKMATIDECIEFALKNIGLWWRYGISRHCDEWKYIITGRIFESEIILIPPSLKISESSSNGSYRNTDEVWWRCGISRSCDEWKGIYRKQNERLKIDDIHLTFYIDMLQYFDFEHTWWRLFQERVVRTTL